MDCGERHARRLARGAWVVGLLLMAAIIVGAAWWVYVLIQHGDWLALCVLGGGILYRFPDAADGPDRHAEATQVELERIEAEVDAIARRWSA